MRSLSLYSKGMSKNQGAKIFILFQLEPETNELMRQARVKRDKTSQMTIRESKLMVMSIIRLILYLSERQLLMKIILKQQPRDGTIRMVQDNKTAEEVIIEEICSTQDLDSERPFEQLQAAIIADKNTSEIFYANGNGILAHWIQFAKELSTDTSYEIFIQSEIEMLYLKLARFGMTSSEQSPPFEASPEVEKMEE